MIAGQREGKHVLIVAYHDPDRRDGEWSLDAVSTMWSDGHDTWFVGDRDYDHSPTREDILELLKHLLWQKTDDLVFRPESR